MRALAAGTALPAYFRDSGPVSLACSGVTAAALLPYAIKGDSSPELREIALFSAPDFAEGHLVFDALWRSGDAANEQGTVAMTLADLA